MPKITNLWYVSPSLSNCTEVCFVAFVLGFGELKKGILWKNHKHKNQQNYSMDISLTFSINLLLYCNSWSNLWFVTRWCPQCVWEVFKLHNFPVNFHFGDSVTIHYIGSD